jgi:hypothetical protein
MVPIMTIVPWLCKTTHIAPKPVQHAVVLRKNPGVGGIPGEVKFWMRSGEGEDRAVRRFEKNCAASPE